VPDQNAGIHAAAKRIYCSGAKERILRSDPLPRAGFAQFERSFPDTDV
jgi:hypothetical protein